MRSILRANIFLAVIFCWLVTIARGAESSIPPGTVITMQNWQNYKDFMPEGMVTLFAGASFWKMPDVVRIEVGPTVIHPLPKGFLEATEKYGRQTKVVTSADGVHNLVDYVAGQPFPDPSEPLKGWKILANVWFRYLPHLIVGTPENMGVSCTEDRFGSIACSKSIIVERRLMHNTDPGIPVDDPRMQGTEYSEWNMVEVPEQLKYSARLTIFFADLTQPQDVYSFRPDLRRSFRLSAANRCGPIGNSDYTEDDVRFGFNGNITRFEAQFLRDQKILALINRGSTGASYPADYDMPLGWPKTNWGKWELRDVSVIDVRRLPAFASGYCYGKRIMYVDRYTNIPLWEDLYDTKMQLWKVNLLLPRAREVPGLGIQESTGSNINLMWDVQNSHASFFSTQDGPGKDWLINEQVPIEYQDVTRFSTPGGLNQIMR